MLSPEYLEQLPTAMVQLFGQLEEDIIIDMARRIAKTGTLTDTAEYQSYRLQQLGAQRRYVMQRLSRITGKAKEELNAIFADAARTTLTYDNELFEQAGYSPAPLDENAQLQQLVRAYRKQTSELFFNLTQTTARTASKQFERALDRAAMQMTSGAFSYQQAIRTAVKSLAAKGVDTIVYRKNGHITQVTSTEVAVRRAVLTGVNQMASHVQLANAEQLGCDLVQVTAHGGARPEHAEWQGGVYSISGRHPKYKKLSTATGYGTGDGLCGWNCRHNFFPFFEGLSEPANTAKQLWDMEHATVTYNGQKMPLYEATQRQREIERNIRRWKREYLAMEAAGQDTTEAAVRLKKWRMIQADFCEKTGLRVDGFRGQVQGFGRSAASKAGWVARKQAQPFSSIRGSGGDIGDNGKTERLFLGTIDPSDTAAVTRLQKWFCSKYASSPVENMMVITKDGEVHFMTDNNPGGVDCSYLGDKLKGSYNIHSHPPNSTQFSFSDDIDMPNVFQDGSAVMEAVDYKYRYRFVMPQGITFEQWDKMRYDVQQDVPRLVTLAGFRDDEYDEQYQHTLMHETCRRLGINCYSRWENDKE